MLSYFIRHKLQTDELWRRLRVVLSSAEAPGEGEHKIAEHIRSARELPRRHCVYGLDADLIMLGLATHAPALCILREKVVFRRASADDKRKQSLAATGASCCCCTSARCGVSQPRSAEIRRVRAAARRPAAAVHIDLESRSSVL